MKEILKKAEIEIKKEIEKVGFIDDSDCSECFLDKLSKKLAWEKLGITEDEYFDDDFDDDYTVGDPEEIAIEILNMINEDIMPKYNKFGYCNDSGYFTGIYYGNEKILLDILETELSTTKDLDYALYIEGFIEDTLKMKVEKYYQVVIFSVEGHGASYAGEGSSIEEALKEAVHEMEEDYERGVIGFNYQINKRLGESDNWVYVQTLGR